MFETLSDEDLVRITRDIADACVRVSEMPPEERERVAAGRSTSPEQAGWLSAVFAYRALQEIDRRGL